LPVLLVPRLGQSEPALAAREQRCRHFREVLLDSCERLGEALLDRPGKVVAKGRELFEASLQVLALRLELEQPLLLLVVLLLREGIHLAETFTAALEPLDLRRQ